MALYVNVEVKINGIVIPKELCSIVSVFGDIESIYSGGLVVLDDRMGKIFSSLVLSIGEKVDIIYTAQDGNNYTCPMSIYSIIMPEADEVTAQKGAKTGSFGGFVQLVLISRWYFGQMIASYAYKGSISDIIKLTIDSNEYLKFNSVNISKSEDPIRPRYRVAETEAQFFSTKLLNYTSIEGRAAFCFTDEFNSFHFKNFNDMYTLKPYHSVIHAVDSAGLPSQSGTKKINLMGGSYGIGLNFDYQFSLIKERAYFYDHATDTVEVKNNPMDFGFNGFTLIDKTALDNISLTGSDWYDIRSKDEQYSLFANYRKPLYTLFHLIVITELAVQGSNTGKSVELIVNDGEDNPGSHWLSGKYVIKRAEHIYDKGNTKTRLILIRPTVDMPSKFKPNAKLHQML
jgi:hypothetical protein